MLVMKWCPVCGKAFEKTGNRQICCSKACAAEMKRVKRLERERSAREARAEHAKCAFCGKDFVKKQKTQKFCCAKCKDEHENAARRAHHAAHPKTRTCVVCGKEFVVTNGNPVVCSKECRKIHSRDIDRAYKAKHNEKRFYKCDGCGKVFQVVGHWYRYCPECRAKGCGSSGRRDAARSEFGLTVDEMNAVAYAQDRLPAEKLYEASQTWTPKQRKYAIARYNQKHMMFRIYSFN